MASPLSQTPANGVTYDTGSHIAQELYHEPRDKSQLDRVLPPWQILMITISGVIGVTIFSTDGEIINTAGPAGLLTALVFVGITAICVMESLSEFVVMWPVSNAMVEYVKMFVDEDLAIVVGLAYWYTWSSVFATLIIAASDFSEYWIHQQIWRTIIFYVIVPLVLLIINGMGVKWYGRVEFVGGILKTTIVAGGAIFLIVAAARVTVGSKNISQNYEYEPWEAKSRSAAVCETIPLLAYGFLGVEIVSVTAFEAKSRSALRNPARVVAYIIVFMYFVCALLEAVAVNWQDKDLPQLQEPPPKPSQLRQRTDANGPGFFAVIVIAAREYGSTAAGWFFNASIIYFCISAANTALYVSSRTLFGLTRELGSSENTAWYLKPFRYLGTTSTFAHVPHWSLLLSAISFFWLPFLQLRSGYNVTSVISIMSTAGSIAGVLVWASQCLAYIRYYRWFHDHKKRKVLNQKYNRWEPRPNVYTWHGSRPLLADFQPIPAWIGFIGCCCIVFIFSSATWWNGKITFEKVATAYGGPVILLAVFIILKLWNRRSWVKLDSSPISVSQVTRYFERNSGLDLGSAETRSDVIEMT